MIKKVIDNQINAATQEGNGLTVYPTERVLGSIKPVKDFAAFYVKHQGDLEVAKASFLLDYCESQLFTPQELKAFKIGLECLFKFFKSAESDTQSYLIEAQKQNRKSVG